MGIKLRISFVICVCSILTLSCAIQQQYVRATELCNLLLKSLNGMYKKSPDQKEHIRTAILFTQNLKQKFRQDKRMKMSTVTADISKITNKTDYIIKEADKITSHEHPVSKTETSELIEHIRKSYRLNI